MFNQAWGGTLLDLGNDLDEHVLENLCERQVRTSTLWKYAMKLYQSDIVLKKKKRPEKLSRIEDCVQCQRRAATPEHFDFSKRAIKRQQQRQQHTL